MHVACPCQDGAKTTTVTEKNSTFFADYVNIFRLAQLPILPLNYLPHLTFTGSSGGSSNYAGDLRLQTGTHLEDLAQHKVAQQHSKFVAPKIIYGGQAPSFLSFIYHVVVQQCGIVHHLNNRCDADVLIGDSVTAHTTKQNQSRPNHLTATGIHIRE